MKNDELDNSRLGALQILNEFKTNVGKYLGNIP